MTRIINKIDKKIFHEEKCFIPTMGALHEGHLSLVKLGKKSTNGKTIVSIFVNKRQFNDESDYDNYPIDLDKDIELLRKEEVDYIFIPQENYIYPKDFAELDGIKSGEKGSLFEGAHRPGHFDGVLTVVKRLFDLVNPTSVVFGKKLFNENAIEYDYLNFVDPKYFETPDSNRDKLLLITAAYAEGIRLIDNMEVIQ